MFRKISLVKTHRGTGKWGAAGGCCGRSDLRGQAAGLERRSKVTYLLGSVGREGRGTRLSGWCPRDLKMAAASE